MVDQAIRTSPLTGRHGGSAGVRLMPAASASRISLRAPETSVAALSSALGLALPTSPKTSARSDGRMALWLGPDEWLVIDDGAVDLVAVVGTSGVLHSAVDVSHRNI